MVRPAARIVLHYLSYAALHACVCKWVCGLSVLNVGMRRWMKNKRARPWSLLYRPLKKLETLKLRHPHISIYESLSPMAVLMLKCLLNCMLLYVCVCVDVGVCLYACVSDVHVICQTDMLAHLCPGSDSKMRFGEGKQFFLHPSEYRVMCSPLCFGYLTCKSFIVCCLHATSILVSTCLSAANSSTIKSLLPGPKPFTECCLLAYMNPNSNKTIFFLDITMETYNIFCIDCPFMFMLFWKWCVLYLRTYWQQLWINFALFKWVILLARTWLDPGNRTCLRGVPVCVCPAEDGCQV